MERHESRLLSRTPDPLLQLPLTLGVTRGGLYLIGTVLLLAIVQTVNEFAAGPLPAHLRPYLMLNHERNLPTWVNGSLLLGAAFAAGLGILAAVDRRERWGWAILAGGLAFLSIDEHVSIHEILPTLVGLEPGTLPTHEWLLPGLVVAVVGASFVGYFVLRLPAPVPRGLLTALVVFFVGAFVFEGLAQWLFRALGPEHWVSMYVAPLLNVPEEGLEMLGALIALRTIVRHLELYGMFRPSP